jgi:hypothetical protein
MDYLCMFFNTKQQAKKAIELVQEFNTIQKSEQTPQNLNTLYSIVRIRHYKSYTGKKFSMPNSPRILDYWAVYLASETVFKTPQSVQSRSLTKKH